MEQRSTPTAAGEILRALVTRHFSRPPALGGLTSALRRRKNLVGGDGSLSLSHRTVKVAAVQAGQGQHAPLLTPGGIGEKENSNNNNDDDHNRDNSNNNGPAYTIDENDDMPDNPGKGSEPRTTVSRDSRGEPLQEIDGAKFLSETLPRTVLTSLGLRSKDECEIAAGRSAPDGGKNSSSCSSYVDEVASQEAGAPSKTSRDLGMEYDAPLARPFHQICNSTDVATRQERR